MNNLIIQLQMNISSKAQKNHSRTNGQSELKNICAYICDKKRDFMYYRKSRNLYTKKNFFCSMTDKPADLLS